MIIRNASKNLELASEGTIAGTWLKRAIGLLGRDCLPEGEGLIIRPCNSVHCFFMRFPIDVLFLAKSGRVLHLVHSMKPWRISKIVRGSDCVVELPGGVLEKTGTVVGDVVEIVARAL